MYSQIPGNRPRHCRRRRRKDRRRLHSGVTRWAGWRTQQHSRSSTCCVPVLSGNCRNFAHSYYIPHGTHTTNAIRWFVGRSYVFISVDNTDVLQQCRALWRQITRTSRLRFRTGYINKTVVYVRYRLGTVQLCHRERWFTCILQTYSCGNLFSPQNQVF